MKEETQSPSLKNQLVLFTGMLIVAPLMIYAGTRKALPATLRYSLIGVGAVTFLYNAYQYFNSVTENEKLKKTLDNIEEKVNHEFDNENKK